jgi:formylglycine-generating enzyme required for sulfatase activity
LGKGKAMWKRFLALAAAVVMVWGAGAARGEEVTLVGSLVCNGACVPAPKGEDHYMVLFAIDGTAEVRADLAKVMEGWPEKGLDADAAEKVMKGFEEKLEFRLLPESPALKGDKNTGKNHYCAAAAASAVTGTVTVKDGQKWILASKITGAALKYPEKMLAADKPFVTSRKIPLDLKINEKLSLRCVHVPPGEFLMGTPVWAWPYFQEEYPHRVKLTKAYYISETPVTQEMYEAVMGENPSAVKDAKLPVENPKFADIDRFCAKVSEKTGRKVRLPTDAEWEYVARVGTSNPGFREKYKEQDSSGAEGFKKVLAVKSKGANAWGVYDMASCWWEITGDKGMYNVRKSETDPAYPPARPEGANSQRNGRGVIKEGWSLVTHEFITEKGYAGQKFRVVVEE